VIVDNALTPNLTCCFDLDSGEFTTIEGTEGLSRVMDTDSNGHIVDVQGSASIGRISDFLG